MIVSKIIKERDLEAGGSVFPLDYLKRDINYNAGMKRDKTLINSLMESAIPRTEADKS